MTAPYADEGERWIVRCANGRVHNPNASTKRWAENMVAQIDGLPFTNCGGGPHVPAPQPPGMFGRAVSERASHPALMAEIEALAKRVAALEKRLGIGDG